MCLDQSINLPGAEDVCYTLVFGVCMLKLGAIFDDSDEPQVAVVANQQKVTAEKRLMI